MNDIKKPSFFDQVVQGAKAAVDDIKNEVSNAVDFAKKEPVAAAGLGIVAMSGIGAVVIGASEVPRKIYDKFQTAEKLWDAFWAGSVKEGVRHGLVSAIHGKIDDLTKAMSLIGVKGNGNAAAAATNLKKVDMVVQTAKVVTSTAAKSEKAMPAALARVNTSRVHTPSIVPTQPATTRPSSPPAISIGPKPETYRPPTHYEFPRASMPPDTLPRPTLPTGKSTIPPLSENKAPLTPVPEAIRRPLPSDPAPFSTLPAKPASLPLSSTGRPARSGTLPSGAMPETEAAALPAAEAARVELPLPAGRGTSPRTNMLPPPNPEAQIIGNELKRWDPLPGSPRVRNPVKGGGANASEKARRIEALHKPETLPAPSHEPSTIVSDTVKAPPMTKSYGSR